MVRCLADLCREGPAAEAFIGVRGSLTNLVGRMHVREPVRCPTQLLYLYQLKHFSVVLEILGANLRAGLGFDDQLDQRRSADQFRQDAQEVGEASAGLGSLCCQV